VASTFQLLTDLLPEPMALVSTAGLIHAANRAFLTVSAVRPAATVGTTLIEAGWTRDDGWPEYLRRCAGTRTFVLAAATHRRTDGQVSAYRCEGAVYEPRSAGREATVLLRLLPQESSSSRFVALTQKIDELSTEITRRHRAELVVREQRELLQVTLTSIGDAVIATDPGGAVTFMNQVAAELTGWPPTEAAGRPIAEVFRNVSEETGDEVENPVAKVLALGQVVGLANHTLLIARDGTARPIDDSGAPIVDASGRLHGVVLVFRDVTALRLAQRQEAAARQAAETASRAKDEFLATLSHELRTPLNAILGWVRILRRGALDEPKRTHALAVIERNADMQARLIEDLLDVSRIMVGQLRLQYEPVDLRTVIASALDAVRPAFDNKSLQVSTVIDVASPVNGDAARLEQVIWNLLTNAAKFTPPNGHVALRAHEDGPVVRIVVSDSGQGFAASFKPQMFEPFTQADASFSRPHGGLGVGLTIVRQLVEAHGGRVDADSAGAGRGATFTVLLPLGARPAATSTRSRPVNGRDLRTLRLLVVEDDADSAELTKTLLESAGADVLVCDNARQALDLIDERAPDVLVADLGLAHEDGLWLIRQVRRREGEGRRLPAVALTAFAAARDRQTALAAGYDAHVPKPLDVDLLLQRIVEVRQGPGPW
jgi:PAS domain S-box-containing protein